MVIKSCVWQKSDWKIDALETKKVRYSDHLIIYFFLFCKDFQIIKIDNIPTTAAISIISYQFLKAQSSEKRASLFPEAYFNKALLAGL